MKKTRIILVSLMFFFVSFTTALIFRSEIVGCWGGTGTCGGTNTYPCEGLDVDFCILTTCCQWKTSCTKRVCSTISEATCGICGCTWSVPPECTKFLPNSTTSKAYYSGDYDDLEQNKSVATSEFTDTNYNQTNVTDDNWYYMEVSSTGATVLSYKYNRYTFNLTGNETAIQNITYCVEGHWLNTYGMDYGWATLEYYNVTDAVWYDDTSIDYQTDSTKCKTFTSIKDIFNSSDNTTQIGIELVAMVAEGPQNTASGLYVDYVNVSVNCPFGTPPPANTAPRYFLNSTNSTWAGTPVRHNLYWTDDTALSGYIFSFWNGSDNVTTSTNAYNWTSTDQEATNKTIQASISANHHSSRYNTTNATRTSAYWASPNVRTPWGGTNGTPAQYANMSSDDQNFASACGDSSQDEPYWRFNFTIEDNINNIEWIELLFSGYENAAETAKCYYYNYTSAGWVEIGTIPDTDGTPIYTNITSGFANYISNNKQLIMYCEGDSYDPGDCIFADYLYAKVSYNSTAYDTEANKTWYEYTGFSGSNYQNVDKVKIVLTIDTYDPRASNHSTTSGSCGGTGSCDYASLTCCLGSVGCNWIIDFCTGSFTGCSGIPSGCCSEYGCTWTSGYTFHEPDLEVGIWNGTAYVNNTFCNVSSIMGSNALNTTDWNCTITTTNSQFRNSWNLSTNRKIIYRGAWLDSNATYSDMVNVTGVYSYLDAWNSTSTNVSFVNDTWVSMVGTGNWSNVTKTVNSTVGAIIQWRVYANDSSNSWNASLIYSYNTTSSSDITPPTYSKNTTNSTRAGMPANFSLEWNDNTALHPNGQWIFSSNNSGYWENHSLPNVLVLTTMVPSIGYNRGYNSTLSTPNENPNVATINLVDSQYGKVNVSDANTLQFSSSSPLSGQENYTHYRWTFNFSGYNVSLIDSICYRVEGSYSLTSGEGEGYVQTKNMTSGNWIDANALNLNSEKNTSSCYRSGSYNLSQFINSTDNTFQIATSAWTAYLTDPGGVTVSIDNIELNFTNRTYFTSTPQNSSYALTLNSTVGTLVAWCYYAKDNAGNWNSTNCQEGNRFILTTSAPAYLEVNLTYPPLPPSTLDVPQNSTFWVNATVTCRNDNCGSVNGTARYNDTISGMKTINTTEGATPFYVNATQQNPSPCGNMNQNDVCNVSWLVNATGASNTDWKIGVLFNSTQSGIASNHTGNATVRISGSIESLSLSWSNIDFGFLNPSTLAEDNPAPGNANKLYNITNTGTCDMSIWIKGTDLQNTTYNSIIGVDNLTWSNSSDTYNPSTIYNMSSYYNLVNSSLPQNSNLTTYYWLSVPAVYSGKYDGTISICGNCSTTCD